MIGKILLNWEKTFNLALGMGPYFGPLRTLEKGLYQHIDVCAMACWFRLCIFCSAVDAEEPRCRNSGFHSTGSPASGMYMCLILHFTQSKIIWMPIKIAIWIDKFCRV